MQRVDLTCIGVRARRNFPTALALVLLAAGLAALPTGAAAQRLGTQPGSGHPLGGVGGGAGIMAPLPPLPPAMQAPTLPAPVIVPQAAPPVVAPVGPAAPASVVRFRCELAPQDQTCREPGAGEDGGGDEACSCDRDICRTTAEGIRVCEKLQ